MTKITVALADDQQLVRLGLRMILDAADDMDVLAEAVDGPGAVIVAHRDTPDVMLMDIRMPGIDGIEATRQITEAVNGTTQVIILTTFDPDEYVYAALRAGASGFLLKDVGPEQLLHAIRIVHAGEALLAPSVTRRLIGRFAAKPPYLPMPSAIEDLTPRELETFTLVAKGLTNAEIAAQLVVSAATVKTHINRIFTKLGLHDRIQAVVLGYETGLITPGSSPPHDTPPTTALPL